MSKLNNLLKCICKTCCHLNGAHNQHNIAIVINVIRFNFAQTNNHCLNTHRHHCHNRHHLNNMCFDNIREKVIFRALSSTNDDGSVPLGVEHVTSNSKENSLLMQSISCGSHDPFLAVNPRHHHCVSLKV